MAYPPHQHLVEDILNLSKATKRTLKDGDLQFATLIQAGVFASDRIPFDALLTDGENVLVDHNGDVLWAETVSVGRTLTPRASVPIPVVEPNRLIISSELAWLEDIDNLVYYRLFIENIDGIPSIMLSTDSYSVEGGGSPYSGDLLINGGLAYLRNISTGLYNEIHVETVGGVASIVLSNEDYDLASGSGSLTEGNLIWSEGKAYLKNTTSGYHHEIYAQLVGGIPTILLSDAGYIFGDAISDQFTGSLIVSGGSAYITNITTGLYHRIFIGDVGGLKAILVDDTAGFIASGDGVPTTGDLLWYDDVCWLKDPVTLLYHQFWLETVDSESSFVVDQAGTTVPSAQTVSPTNDLVWNDSKAYLKNHTDNFYREIYAETIDGEPSLMNSDTSYATLP